MNKLLFSILLILKNGLKTTDLFEFLCFTDGEFELETNVPTSESAERPMWLKLEFRNIEQSFGLCGRGRGWDDLGEWH